MKIRRSSVAQRPESKPASVLARQCERALVAAARSARISTRRRIHQAAHEFIRRHARNRAYLAWVMKRVAANAALAIALLGLDQGAAHAAGAPVFDPFPLEAGYQFPPFDYTPLGPLASPALADLDADGDFDLIVGSGYSLYSNPNYSIRYFQNTGSATSPAYVERTGAANPLNSFSRPVNPPAISFGSMPAVVDLNGDGALDVVVADFFGSFTYFVNTGTPTAPRFDLSAANPLAGQNVGGSLGYASFSLGDLDEDGDFDLVAGNSEGGLFYLENTGTAIAPGFVARVGSANPLNAFAGVAGTGTSDTAPALGDFDGDGDLDVAIGRVGGFGNDPRYLENTGSATSPAFRELSQAANPFRGEARAAEGGRDRFAVADLDADGDLDLVRGSINGSLTRLMNQFGQIVASADTDPSPLGFSYESATPAADFDNDGDREIAGPSCLFATNIGQAIAPAFSGAGPLPGLTNCSDGPISVDLDGDGDSDVVAAGVLHLNSGTRTTPSFGSSQMLFPALDPEQGFRAIQVATFGDLDRDGDLDAAVHYRRANPNSDLTAYYENTGTSGTPLFVFRTGSANLLPTLSEFTRIRLVDPDGDGDSDAFQTFSPGEQNTSYWEDIGTTSPQFSLRDQYNRKNPLSRYLNTTTNIAQTPVTLGDLDGDGDGDSFGMTFSFNPGLVTDGFFLENGIVRPSARFKRLSFSLTLDAGNFSSPAAGDLDGDGDPDVVASESFASGVLRFYKNTGTATAPRFVERVGSANPFTGLNAGWTPMLALGDLDSDGDLDLLAGEPYGGPLHYFQNTGTSTAPAFAERVGGANPANNVTGDRSAPALGDLDRDGDLDITIGGSAGNFRYFRNTGSARNPVFAEQVGAASPFNGLVAGVGFISNPALGDIDLDGDLDLVSGDEPTGGFHYFENTGTANAPAFVSRAGPDNPLNGESVGLNSTPALIDLDADGELDLVSGKRDGTFETYVLPEPSKGLLLSAGIVLLGWLRRKRG